MNRYYRTRTTYAQNHRVSAPRSSGGIYATSAGEGILHQTCAGATQGFDAPIVERSRADGSPLFFVESEKFAGRYYGLYQQKDGTWVFSGDAKLLQCYVAKVEAFRAEQMSEAA
jgi:hypothetical protein